MGSFIIEPNLPPDYSHLYDNAFLWHEDNVYIMACHRLALWCWLQQANIFSGEYSLIHIDRHTDARRWEAPGEQEALPKLLESFQDLADFEIHESLKLPLRKILPDDRDVRPTITWDNFVHLAAEARLFKHYYIYSSDGDWHTSLESEQYSHFRQTRAVYQLADAIKASDGKCVIDIDLDFFDDMEDYIKKISDRGMLEFVLQTIAKHRDLVSLITISTNDTPGFPLWEKRMSQMEMVNDILGLNVPIPIMT